MIDTPRANAKPRDSIHQFWKFEGSPPQGESTRLVTDQCFSQHLSAEKLNLEIDSPPFHPPGCDYSPMVGASPSLNNSNKRSRGKKSFTEIETPPQQIKSPKQSDKSTGKKNTPTRTPKNSINRHSSQSDDDQPSGTVRFTGESQSKINKSLNNSSRRLMSTSPREYNKKDYTPESALLPSNTESSHTGLKMMGIAAVLLGVGAVSMGVMDKKFTPDWKTIKNQFKTDVDILKGLFPTQTKSTFKTIKIAMDPGLQKEAEHPGALILMYPPGGMDTANCLIEKLTASLQNAFQSSRLSETDVEVEKLMISASSIQSGRLGYHDLQKELTDRLSVHRVAALLDVDRLHAETAHALQGILDNSGAPYKNAAVLMTMESSKAADAVHEATIGSCQLDEAAERILREKWSALGKDKIDALVSRVTVAVVGIQHESGINLVCQ